MKKSTYIILASLLLVFLSSMWLLKSYSLELIHFVVTQTLIQKAPSDYPSVQIERAFQDALKTAMQEEREDEYRDRLLEISQRIEKVQRLGEDEINQLLGTLIKSEEKSR